jgi:hypothetical protein
VVIFINIFSDAEIMKPLAKIVASGTTHSSLMKQLSAQRALHEQLKLLLPPPLESQLKAAVLQNGNLTLFVTSPVWASRFRYLLPQLQGQLRQQGITVTKARTSILPNDSIKSFKTKKRNRPILSQTAGKQLREIATTINDRSLQEALERLSRHSEES